MTYDPQKDYDKDGAFLERQGRMKTDYSGVYTGAPNGTQLVTRPPKYPHLPKLGPVKK